MLHTECASPSHEPGRGTSAWAGDAVRLPARTTPPQPSWPGYPQSTKINCGTSTNRCAIEVPVTAGGRSLSYDSLTDTYNYVWKTHKSWAGTCRQLEVRLADGTFHYVNFKFKWRIADDSGGKGLPKSPKTESLGPVAGPGPSATARESPLAGPGQQPRASGVATLDPVDDLKARAASAEQERLERLNQRLRAARQDGPAAGSP